LEVECLNPQSKGVHHFDAKGKVLEKNLNGDFDER
jgi:hypothetical protein